MTDNRKKLNVANLRRALGRRSENIDELDSPVTALTQSSSFNIDDTDGRVVLVYVLDEFSFDDEGDDDGDNEDSN